MFAGGVCGDLIDQTSWSATPLGPIAAWPASLKTMVGTMLASRHPMFLWWGPELIQFYNDAYLPSFGIGKHPTAMGQRGRDCWGEVWPIIWPQIEDVMARGKASWNEDHLVPIFRNGRIEEVYWTYGYSPVRDDRGRIAGTLVVCTETTSRVIAERRLGIMRRLADATLSSENVALIGEHALCIAESAALDIPFALAYRVETPGNEPRSTHRVRVDEAAVSVIDAAVRKAPAGPEPCLVELGAEISVPGNPWPEPCTRIWVARPRTSSLGIWAFGVSSRLPADASYCSFVEDFVEELDVSAARVEASLGRARVESDRRNLLLQAPVPAALLIGPTHVFELANAAYRELAGGRDVIGKPLAEAFPEISGTPLQGIFERVYATGVGYTADEHPTLLDRHGDGELAQRYFKFHIEPLRDGSGAVYGIMTVAIDISEQVRARRVLERISDERQNLLTELERASQAKDEFLATISHELRTPLTAMLGWARVLQEEAGDPLRIKKGLAVIERNATIQAQLIDDILDVSRIVAGKIRLSMRRVKLATVIGAAVETTRPTSLAKEVRISVEQDENLGEIVADEDRLQQIVWNLLSNAVKFSHKGGLVSVRARRQPSSVSISVRDEGKGISASFLPNVFDRFRQDDASTTKQQAGLGLGLAIVRHLVELHGGTVSAASEGEGRGSTFEVKLPVQQVVINVDPTDVSSTDTTQPGAQLLGSISVLVVDDQTDSRELVATVLSNAGARVKQAHSVTVAFEVLARSEVHVIVSDIGMPDADGYQFLRRLRAMDSEQRDIPAIALSAFDRSEDRERAVAAGFHEYASKPIDPRRLVTLVAIVAGQRGR